MSSPAAAAVSLYALDYNHGSATLKDRSRGRVYIQRACVLRATSTSRLSPTYPAGSVLTTKAMFGRVMTRYDHSVEWHRHLDTVTLTLETRVGILVGRPPMLAILTAFTVLTLIDPPERKEPPTKDELAAITDRGRDLAGYDAAAWHASDAVQAKQPREGSVVRYIARKIDKKWVVAFGRLDEKGEKFLIAYEAIQSAKTELFDVKEMTPPKEDTGFFLSAAKAIDISLKDFREHFEGEQRPYNVVVLPAKKGRIWVYLVPAPTKPNVWPLGDDFRYLISADGTKIVSKRQLHKSIIEVEPPKDKDKQQVAGGIHTHVLDDIPEDTDVFHVLTRKPAVPEMVITKQFVFQVDPDGSVTYVGKSEDVLKKK
jgi:hypothetical protein